MTPPPVTLPTARTARLIHAALITGIVLFAVVAQFVMKAQWAGKALPPIVPQALLGVSVTAMAVSFLLRRRLPRRSLSDSADLYWSTAMAPAIVMWAPLEAACLLSVITWAFTGSPIAVAIAAVALLIFMVQNPARLENPDQ